VAIAPAVHKVGQASSLSFFPSHEPPAHWNHRLTLRLTTNLLLLGEKAGMRADVSSSRRDWLPPRFRVRKQFPSEQATSHEPPAHWNHRLTLRLTAILLLLGEKAGMRADVSSSRRDWLPSRFLVRQQFQSEPAAAHEPAVLV
jgi:hypothetical protein